MSDKLTLYAIDSAYDDALNAVREYAAEHDGEIDPGLADKLDQLELDRNAKIGSCIAWYKREVAMADALYTEADALTKRASTHAANADWMKQYVGAIVGPKVKWEGVQGKIAWRESTTCEVSVPVEQLPAEYVRIVPESKAVDKKAIGAALKDGKVIEGCTLVKHDNIQLK